MNTNMQTYIIAEAGVNHNGDLELAKKLIDVAVEAGVDAIKFQSFRAENVISRNAPKAEYQIQMTDNSESQLDMIRKLELSEQEHKELIAYAKEQNIIFLSTPFDIPSVYLLTKDLGLKTLKVPSGEISNLPFLLVIARSAEKVILSTGMSTLSEIEMALGVFAFGFTRPTSEIPKGNDFEKAFCSQEGQIALNEKLTILHCTTEYPAPFPEVNLAAMETLHTAFGVTVGYSDHTTGIHISLAAVARGAKTIEKHFTLDRTMEGPDHKASLEPNELCALVRQTREIEQALGDGVKRVTASEWKNRDVARKSLVAASNIKKGDVFTEENLTCKRPGTGISANQWYGILGKTANRSFDVDELIEI